MSVRTIARAEDLRHRYRIAPDTLERLARTLGVTMRELVWSSPAEQRDELELHGFSLPPIPEPWFGRELEVRMLDQWLRTEAPQPCCIAGPDGVGKTALATVMAGRLAEEFACPVLWIDGAAHESFAEVRRTQRQIAEALL